MKTRVLLFGLAMIGLVPFGLTGCQEKEKPAPVAVETKAVETAPAAPSAVAPTVEEAVPAAEHPANAKPKDHPAH